MLSSKVKLCTGVMLLAVILIESVTSDCNADLERLHTPSFTLKEGAKNGSWSFKVTHDGNIQITTRGQSLFRTDDGFLILNRDLDLDGPQSKDLCNTYGSQFLITIKCEQGTTDAILRFEVNFIQDKPLRFRNSSYHVEKREQNYGDAMVVNMAGEAVDDDCGHPTINYRLKDDGSGSQPFSISRGVISTKSILDYEQRNSYTLTVEAFTQGSVTQSVTTNLTISVLDIDDEDPRFEYSSYNLNVTEETNVTGTWLTSDPPLKAVDGDKGLNETIQYSLVAPVNGLDVDVDSSTGRIQIHTVLDRETKSQYTVGVKASQANNPLRSTTAILTIDVVDVNDHHPVFLNRQGEVIPVKEGTPEGTFITSVKAEDEDEGDNAQFTYKLTDPSGAFGLEKDAMSGTRWIVLKNSSALEGRDRVHVQVLLEPKFPMLIDGEACDFVDSCVLNLTMDVSTTTTPTTPTTTPTTTTVPNNATDNNSTSTITTSKTANTSNTNATPTATSPTTSTTIQTATSAIIITNPHTPTFQKSDYRFIYNETETLLGQVSATDKDNGPSGTISYSLKDVSSGCDALNLTINQTTGSMKTLGVRVSLDSLCLLKAQACDNPTNPAEQKCATVPVIIIAQNTIVKPTISVVVLESVPVGTTITTLPESNLKVTDDRFSIQKNDLVTEKLLDRESNVVIKVHIFKYEENVMTLYEVKVTLENVNDNAPVFSKEVYPVFLERFEGDTHTGGRLLVTVDAQDADGLSIDPLTYSLLEQSDWLSIGNETGKVWLEAPPPLGEMGDKFTLYVKVKDSGTPPLSDTALVEIYRPLYKTSIYITLPLPLDEVNKRKTEITSFLTNTLKYTVTIDSVEHIDNVPDWSKVLIIAQRKNGDLIARDALESMVSSHQATIQAQYTDDDDDDVLTTPFIIVMCLAILLLLLLIAVWIMSIRTKRRLKEKASIFRTSIHSSTMYDNVGTTRSNKLYDTLLTNETETLERNGVVNPVFRPDCDEENGEGNSHTMAEESANDTSQRRGSRDDGEDLEMSEECPDRSYHLEADASITRIDEVLAQQSADGEERTDDLTDSISGSDNHGDIVDPVVNSPAFSGSDGFYPSLEGEGDESGSGVGEGDESGSGVGEGDESVSGVGSSPQLSHSNADIWDTSKNSDADSGMPSDRDDLANDNDDDDNNDDDDDDDGDDRDTSSVGFFSKVRKDFDRPVPKHVTNITIGFTNLDNEEDTHNDSMEPNVDEPEPDYGKKVRFEGAGDGGDVGQGDSNRHFFQDTQTTAF